MMSEEEAAKVNELLDDAARSAVSRQDLRSGFYTDPSTAGSWHHMSDEDIKGTPYQWSVSIAEWFVWVLTTEMDVSLFNISLCGLRSVVE